MLYTLNSHTIIVYSLYKVEKEKEELQAQIMRYRVGEANILLI